jgi:hypothetical protein
MEFYFATAVAMIEKLPDLEFAHLPREIEVIGTHSSHLVESFDSLQFALTANLVLASPLKSLHDPVGCNELLAECMTAPWAG